MVFDATATTAPKNYKALPSDTISWPRLVHLSWIELNSELKPVRDYDLVVSRDGFKISGTTLKYAKLDDDDISKKSKPLEEILTLFVESVNKADYIFAHNLAGNAGIVGAELVRNSMKNVLSYANSFCLMQESTWFCKIPNKRGEGYKWPSLNELHGTLFKKQYSPSNNARADVIAATRSFIALKKIGQLEDVFDID